MSAPPYTSTTLPPTKCFRSSCSPSPPPPSASSLKEAVMPSVPGPRSQNLYKVPTLASLASQIASSTLGDKHPQLLTALAPVLTDGVAANVVDAVGAGAPQAEKSAPVVLTSEDGPTQLATTTPHHCQLDKLLPYSNYTEALPLGPFEPASAVQCHIRNREISRVLCHSSYSDSSTETLTELALDLLACQDTDADNISGRDREYHIPGWSCFSGKVW